MYIFLHKVQVMQGRDYMKLRGQSYPDVPGLIRSLVHPKHAMRIGNWNARILLSSGNIAQTAKEMSTKDFDIIGISETHYTRQGKMQLQDGRPWFILGGMTTFIERG